MIAGIVLAAGASSRLGRPKQLLPLRGRPLLEATLQIVAATDLTPVVVVLGGASDDVLAQVRFGAARPIVNSDYRQGQSTSLVAGLAAVEAAAQAVVFILGDQPLQSTQVIDQLITAYNNGAGSIIVPRYSDMRGNPVLFDRSQFPALAGLQGDQGARPLLRAHPELVHEIAFPDLAAPVDIDTWDDYRAVAQAAGDDDPGPQGDA